MLPREQYNLTVNETIEGAAYQIISNLAKKDSTEYQLTIGQRTIFQRDDIAEFADVIESAQISGSVSSNVASMKNLNKIQNKGPNTNEFAARPLNLTYYEDTNTWVFETVRLLNNSTNTSDIVPEAVRFLQASSSPDNVFYPGEDMVTTIGYNVVSADGSTILADGSAEEISFVITTTESGAAILTAAVSVASLALALF